MFRISIVHSFHFQSLFLTELLAPRRVRGRLRDAALDCGGGELIEENEGMREKRGED